MKTKMKYAITVEDEKITGVWRLNDMLENQYSHMFFVSHLDTFLLGGKQVYECVREWTFSGTNLVWKEEDAEKARWFETLEDVQRFVEEHHYDGGESFWDKAVEARDALKSKAA